MPEFLQPQTIIQTLGLIGVVGALFAESGLLVGMFLPGDSLLFVAGIVASDGHLSLPLLLSLGTIAAIAGDQVGYLSGRKFGPKIFSRAGSRFLSPDHLARAHAFYEKHGKMTIFFARFTPIVRTLAPIIAGIGNMHYKTFLKYNIAGGIAWVFSMTLVGYFLGKVFPGIDKYLHYIIIAIIIVSLVPTFRHLISRKKKNISAQ